MHREVLALVAALPCAVLAQPASYHIDGARTQARFEVEHLGVLRAQGRFANVSGRLSYDASSRSGAIDLTIPVASVATGWDSRDSFLRGSTMLDAASFPGMRFVSRRFEFEGDRVVRVDGDLTLHGVTRPVNLDIGALQCERETCTAQASGAIRRREFGIDAWWPLIGDDVQLTFRLAAIRD